MKLDRQITIQVDKVDEHGNFIEPFPHIKVKPQKHKKKKKKVAVIENGCFFGVKCFLLFTSTFILLPKKEVGNFSFNLLLFFWGDCEHIPSLLEKAQLRMDRGRITNWRPSKSPPFSFKNSKGVCERSWFLLEKQSLGGCFFSCFFLHI